MKITGAPAETQMMPVAVEEHVHSSAPAASAEESDVKLPRETRMPTEANPAEKRLYALTHLPHRDWCEVCVKARGKDTAHQQKEDIARIAENVDGLEVVELDYTYMEDLKILTLYACAHHGGAATAVERKGP